jgi:hypothetical protein
LFLTITFIWKSLKTAVFFKYKTSPNTLYCISESRMVRLRADGFLSRIFAGAASGSGEGELDWGGVSGRIHSSRKIDRWIDILYLEH